MKVAPLDVWTLFKSALCGALDDTPYEQLLEAWKSGPHKTVFYERTIMPDLSMRLGYQLQTERHRCDYAFLNTQGVPLIFTEAENAHRTACHEIGCLCSLASPLKVLFISCDWHESEKTVFLPLWSEIIRLHHSVITMNCLYAIVVGGWDDNTPCEYSFTLLDTAGEVIEESRHIVKSTLAAATIPHAS